VAERSKTNLVEAGNSIESSLMRRLEDHFVCPSLSWSNRAMPSVRHPDDAQCLGRIVLGTKAMPLASLAGGIAVSMYLQRRR